MAVVCDCRALLRRMLLQFKGRKGELRYANQARFLSLPGCLLENVVSKRAGKEEGASLNMTLVLTSRPVSSCTAGA